MNIDLQVNGYLGCDFSSPQLSEDNFRTTCRNYLHAGADAFFPTLITSSLATYKQLLPMMAKVISESEFDNRILGLHLEGPFISNKPGAVGAHNPLWTQEPSMELLNILQDLAEGTIKIITMAAELKNAADLCQHARTLSIHVSLGHQEASYDDLCRLFDHGATALTHLGNGLPNMVHRHENALIHGLCHPHLIPMIIADGCHLPKFLLEGIINLKGVDHVIVVSDASSIAGCAPGSYNSMGNDIILDASGRLFNPAKNCLVGSSFTLNLCQNYLKKYLEFDDMIIQKLTYRNPLNFIHS